MTMNLAAAKAVMVKMKAEGLSNAEIAKRLQDKGYVNSRNPEKGPINAFGVGYHLRTINAKKAPAVKLAATRTDPLREAGPTSPGHATSKPRSKIDLALEIMMASEIGDVEVRKEIAKRILNA